MAIMRRVRGVTIGFTIVGMAGRCSFRARTRRSVLCVRVGRRLSRTTVTAGPSRSIELCVLIFVMADWYTRNDYKIFYEEWLAFTPIRSQKNYSPGCDWTCPAVARPGAACECGAQEFYLRVHDWHGRFVAFTGKPCPCFPCRVSGG